MRLMSLALAAVLGLSSVRSVAAQGTLEAAAEHVRHAWEGHKFDEVMAGADQVRLQFPGRGTSEPLQATQAVAMLRDFIGQSVESATSVFAVRDLGGGRGYVEIQRRFQVPGTQGIRSQRLLLSYRRAGNGWVLAEFRVLD